jgi:hypothetical protein
MRTPTVPVPTVRASLTLTAVVDPSTSEDPDPPEGEPALIGSTCGRSVEDDRDLPRMERASVRYLGEVRERDLGRQIDVLADRTLAPLPNAVCPIVDLVEPPLGDRLPDEPFLIIGHERTFEQTPRR